MRRYQFIYFIREGIRGIFLHGFMSFAAVSIIVACLLIMGSFTLLAINVEHMITDLEQESELLVYVDANLSEEQAKTVGIRIDAIENVLDYEFISREQALAAYIERLGGKNDILRGLESDTFRHRYRVYLEDISKIQQTVDTIENFTGVAKVNAPLELSKGFNTLRRVVNAVSFALIAMLLVISVFIISNTVKLATFDRREEIAIMKMVGATNGFIRWPFVVEGLILGLLGAFFAYFIQWGVYSYVVRGIGSADGLSLIKTLSFSQVASQLALIFSATGFFVGIGGSVLTIRKFLRV